MPLVPKITRFTKLPELLKHKQEAEEKQKKGRQDRQGKDDHPPFHIDVEDEVTLSPQSISGYKVHSPAKEPKQPKTSDDKKGGHIDLQA
ncbi:MAG: hypothetical protein CL670_08500 [Balneola sp.]|jgi:hypothetical protein|nr:hypothetical protein [Balneola sp.]MBE79178.1 hypothetical protein [Balneola sp.]|tara:strand:- start:252 stop:518 length:267 start_codon:yes stop_codon:yes gene_type:complete